MEHAVEILKTALPVFLALFLGALARRTKLLSREGVDALKKTVVQITLPAVLFGAFAAAEYSLSSVTVPAAMFLLCCLGLLLGRLGAKLLRLPGRLSPFLCAGFEAGMLGYALYSLLYPGEGTSRFALVDLGQTLFVFTVYKSLLTGKGGFRSAVREAVRTPILWAVFAGILVGATGLYRGAFAEVAGSAAGFVAAPTGMVILLTVGYDLRLGEIRWAQTAGQIALRLVSMAILLGVLLFLNRTVLAGAVPVGAAVLMFLLPPPYVLPVFGDEPAERAQIASAISALTVLTMVFFVVLTAVGRP